MKNKETLEDKICCVNWTPLDFLEKDGVIPTKDVKEFIKEFIDVLKKTSEDNDWEAVLDNGDDIITIDAKEFINKLAKQKFGKGLL